MRIIAVCGSSGGHIFPARAFLERLRQEYPQGEILFVLPKKSIDLDDLEAFFKIRRVSVSGITLKPPRAAFRSLINSFRAGLESLGIILSFKPDAVVGFGSFSSLPLLWLAWFFRIPTLIHEQNVVPGKANRFLAVFVDKIAVTFEESRKYFKNFRSKVVLTGMPLRSSIVRIEQKVARDYFGLSGKCFTLLVTGGSQGSHRVNFAFLDAARKLAVDHEFQVIHLCGAKDLAELREVYEKSGIRAKVFAFLKEMQYAYSASDAVISRAGALSLSEITFFALPALLVPYPYAYRHQSINARLLEEAQCAEVIEEERLDADRLKSALAVLIEDPQRLARMRDGYRSFAVRDAAGLLCHEVVSLVRIE
jgi:UDP-N-acetylglucosamine--N-acetylmuramyl-(pentapeptide) pyrophosphoryl-undecaprenol N-acetylglucosamine transferase